MPREHLILCGGARPSGKGAASMLRALRESGGWAVAVEDDAILAARAALARRGLFVETTSAVPVAALPAIRERLSNGANILIPLSGSGLKEGAKSAPPPLFHLKPP